MNAFNHYRNFLFVIAGATAVAWELYQIFTTQGCPLILQHDNGREFVNQVILRLKQLWPECIIVRGRPRHPQTQGSVERANKDVEEMLGKWMAENACEQWSVGIFKVDNDKNNRWHRTIKSTPYQLIFGQKQRVDMRDLPMDKQVLQDLKTEVELEQLLGFKSTTEMEVRLGEEDLGVEEEDEDDEHANPYLVPDDEDTHNEIPGLCTSFQLVNTNGTLLIQTDVIVC